MRARGWVLGLLLSASPAWSTPERCDFALDLVWKARSWKHLHDAWRKYPDCDDGVVADSYSEFVVHTLATHWETLWEANWLMERDPAFRAFVLGHIDATTDVDELSRILANAKLVVPRGTASLCREIASRAKRARSEIQAVKKASHRP